MKLPRAVGLIKTFTTVPKELFRVNKGLDVALRAFTKLPKGKYDLLTVNGMVLPKALDPDTYAGNDSASEFEAQLTGSAPNGASMRPNSPYQQRFVKTTKASNVLVYCVPRGMSVWEPVILGIMVDRLIRRRETARRSLTCP